MRSLKVVPRRSWSRSRVVFLPISHPGPGNASCGFQSSPIINLGGRSLIRMASGLRHIVSGGPSFPSLRHAPSPEVAVPDRVWDAGRSGVQTPPAPECLVAVGEAGLLGNHQRANPALRGHLRYFFDHHRALLQIEGNPSFRGVVRLARGQPEDHVRINLLPRRADPFLPVAQYRRRPWIGKGQPLTNHVPLPKRGLKLKSIS